jgi:hypothetical protein
MMPAIHTKYISATGARGSRIKAYTSKGLSVTIPYPHEKSHEFVYFEAVKALVKKYKLDWNIEKMRFGDSADGKGYVFCFDSSVVNE